MTYNFDVVAFEEVGLPESGEQMRTTVWNDIHRAVFGNCFVEY
jgi:hypothetical protein